MNRLNLLLLILISVGLCATTARAQNRIQSGNSSITINDDSTITMKIAGSGRYTLDTSGHIVPVTTNVQDLGSAAKKFRTLYLGTSIVFGDGTTQTSATQVAVNAPLTNSGTSQNANLSIIQAGASASGYLSSTDWNTFNNKQAALGFTPENVSNKDVDGTLASNSDTKYPSQKAVKTYSDALMTTNRTLGGIFPFLASATPKNLFVGNAGSGNVDLYTVPSGKRLYVSNLIVFNTAGTATTTRSQVKISGSYYRLSSSQSVTAGTSNTSMIATFYVLEAGEILSLNTSQAGLNVWVRAIEFDNTSPLKSVKISSTSSGNNIIYTVPAGKSAFIQNTIPTVSLSSPGVIMASNESAGSVVWIAYLVPSGGSQGSTNQCTASITTATTILANASIPGVINAGDSVVINVSSGAGASELFWVTVSEY